MKASVTETVTETLIEGNLAAPPTGNHLISKNSSVQCFPNADPRTGTGPRARCRWSMQSWWSEI